MERKNLVEYQAAMDLAEILSARKKPGEGIFMTEKDTNNSLITIEQLSESLQVPKSWVYSRTRQLGPGSIPKVKVGKYLRFRLGDVLRWIEANQ